MLQALKQVIPQALNGDFPALQTTLDRLLNAPASVIYDFADWPYGRLLELSCTAGGGQCEPAASLTTTWLIAYQAAHLIDRVSDCAPADCVDQAPIFSTLAAALLSVVGLRLEAWSSTWPHPTTAQAVRLDFHTVTHQACIGHLHSLHLPNPTLEQAWDMARQKTGATFALASRTGARLAPGCDVEAASRFGLNLGLLVQISDDVHDLRPSEIGSDLQRGTWRLPAAYAMQVLPETNRQRLVEYLQLAAVPGPGNASALSSAYEMIVESGSLLYLAVEARRLQAQAGRSLLQFTQPGQERQALQEILESTSFVP